MSEHDAWLHEPAEERAEAGEELRRAEELLEAMRAHRATCLTPSGVAHANRLVKCQVERVTFLRGRASA